LVKDILDENAAIDATQHHRFRKLAGHGSAQLLAVITARFVAAVEALVSLNGRMSFMF
jgi:hypothetical protein